MDEWIEERTLLFISPSRTGAQESFQMPTPGWHKGASATTPVSLVPSSTLSPAPPPPPHTSCDGDPPALVVVSQGHSIALLGGHNPDGAHAVLALHIGVVAWVPSRQLGIELVVDAGWGEGISNAITAERLILPDHDGCCGGRGKLVGAWEGHWLE